MYAKKYTYKTIFNSWSALKSYYFFNFRNGCKPHLILTKSLFFHCLTQLQFFKLSPSCPGLPLILYVNGVKYCKTPNFLVFCLICFLSKSFFTVVFHMFFGFPLFKFSFIFISLLYVFLLSPPYARFKVVFVLQFFASYPRF